MRHFRNIYFALAAFLWLPASVHCQIESFVGLEILQCQAASTAQPADNHGCDENDCCLVEQTDYCPGTSRMAKVSLALISAPFCCRVEIPAPVSIQSAPASPAVSPPFLINSWPFISRASLPVRAPSFVS